jgi:hypothetical protein
MNDQFERDLTSWMDEIHIDSAEVERLRSIALPARRRWFAGGMRIASGLVSLALVLAVGVFALGRAGGGAGSPRPPNPAAFAGDARLDRCGVTSVDQAIAVFEMKHAADYLVHLPKMGRSPELEVPDPALVIVLADRSTLGGLSGASPAGPANTPESAGRTVCVVVGTDPASADVNVYENVDTSGLTVDTAP